MAYSGIVFPTVTIEHEGNRITFAIVESVSTNVVEHPLLGYRLSLTVEGYIQAANQEEAEQSVRRILGELEKQ